MIPIIGVIVGITTVAAAPYQSRYDHLDVETVLNNRRMVNYYAACLLTQGPCPPQGVDLKRILPEALATNCAKCTEKQRTIAYRAVKRLKKEYPKIWAQLAAEWDPDDVYVRKFEMSFETGSSIATEDPVSSTIAPVSSSEAPVILGNRFGDPDDSNVASSASPSPSTSTTIRTTLTSATTKRTTKYTNKPLISITQSHIFVTKPSRAPPFTTVGANIKATVTFTAALKKLVLQLYRYKLEVINNILSG